MFIDFEELPKTARVWVYQADRNLTTPEVINLTEKIQNFIAQWQAHQQALKGSVKIAHQRFIVIAVDEAFHTPSGCSIDASVHFLQALEKEFQVKETFLLCHWH